MKRYQLFYLLIILYFIGCKSHASHNIWPIKMEMAANVKENAHPLSTNIVESSYDFIYAKEFFVYNDSIMIVLNKPNIHTHFIEFYNLNSDKIINNFIRMGNGPGEMLNTLAHISKNQLIVHDFIKNQIVSINIDSVLCNSNYKINPLIQFSNNVGSPFVTFFNDTKLILQNPFYFYNDELKIDNEEPRFIITESGKLISKESENKYYTYNVSQGFIIPNSDKNRIIYASHFLNELEIYDMNLNRLKLITGPDDLKPNYRLYESNQIIFTKNTPYSYRNYTFDDDYFYLSYVGAYFTQETKLQNFKSWILKFDWEGNFIDSFYSHEYISSISKSPNSDLFYGRGFDKDGVTVLWRLSFKE